MEKCIKNWVRLLLFWAVLVQNLYAQDATEPLKPCKTHVTLVDGRKHRGHLDTTASEGIWAMKKKRGRILYFSEEAIISKKQLQCKEFRAMNSGFFHTATFALSMNELFFRDKIKGTNRLYRDVFPQAIWRVQHRFGYHFANQWSATASIGVEGFRHSTIVYRIGGRDFDETKVYRHFLSLPLMVGGQKHFTLRRLGQFFIGVEAGNSFQSALRSNVYDNFAYYYNQWSGIEQKRGGNYQISFGYLHLDSVGHGIQVEFNLNHKRLFYYNTNVLEESSAIYMFTRPVLRIGFLF